jgi:hypothetical protein
VCGRVPVAADERCCLGKMHCFIEVVKMAANNSWREWVTCDSSKNDVKPMACEDLLPIEKCSAAPYQLDLRSRSLNRSVSLAPGHRLSARRSQRHGMEISLPYSKSDSAIPNHVGAGLPQEMRRKCAPPATRLPRLRGISKSYQQRPTVRLLSTTGMKCNCEAFNCRH